jgi:hypothetical protein
VGKYLLAELELVRGRGEREERARVTHGEAARAKVRLDELGQLEQAKAIRHAAPILADALAKLLLRPGELGEKSLVCLGFFHRVQVFAEEVFYKSQLESLGIAGLSDDRGYARETGHLSSPPASFTHNYLKLLTKSPNHDRLQNTGALEGLR